MSVMTFEYRAVNKSGQTVRGQQSGASESEAYRKLIAVGLTPVTIRPAKLSTRRARVRVGEVAQFTNQLAVLVSARVPLSEGLLSIAEQESNPAMRAVVSDIASSIESGENIASALEKHRAVFGDVYIETVRAAEKAGSLGKVLEHLSEMLERTEETRRQVKGALTYPVMVIIVLVVAVVFLLGFVVPKFGKMFKSRGMDLPGLTQALMMVGDSLQVYWWAYLLGVGGVVFAVRRVWASKQGRERIDDLLHKVPVIKGILQGAAVSRFAHVLGLSLSSGLGLIESLELAGRASGRPKLRAQIDGVVTSVRSGARLTDALRSCDYFTGFTKRMLGAGENAGEMPRMCAIVARQYDRTTAHVAKAIATLIEPVLVVGIAGVVLIVALAIFLPMWNMVNLVGR